MSDKYADLIAGVVLSQELLVRCLEDHGVLERGSYRSALEGHLREVSPDRQDETMYAPMKILISALAKPAPERPRRH